jgi:hypothetical protein
LTELKQENSVKTTFKQLNLHTLQDKELNLLKRKVVLLKQTLVNTTSVFIKKVIVSFDWKRKCNYNHFEVKKFDKTVYKKYKDFNFLDDFSYSVPFIKSTNNLSEVKILWTNLSSILKIVITKEESLFTLKDLKILEVT